MPRNIQAIENLVGNRHVICHCIDELDLRPGPEYPAVPLLLEYAGNDHTGRGHIRSNDIYLLWRYERERGRWVELAKCLCQGTDWLEHLKPVALRELSRTAPPVDASTAAGVSDRILSMLDQELDVLTDADRRLVMSFVYQQFSARAVAYG